MHGRLYLIYWLLVIYISYIYICNSVDGNAIFNTCEHGVPSYIRADSRLAASQWETSLQTNTVSYSLGANLESALIYDAFLFWLYIQIAGLLHYTNVVIVSFHVRQPWRICMNKTYKSTKTIAKTTPKQGKTKPSAYVVAHTVPVGCHMCSSEDAIRTSLESTYRLLWSKALAVDNTPQP